MSLPVAAPYPQWCEHCNWNVAAPPAEERRRASGALDDRLASRLGQRLASEFSAGSDLRPQWTPTRVAIYVLAFLTFALTALILVGGVALLVVGVGQPNIIAIILGVVAVLLAYLMRPRFGRVPPSDHVEPGRAQTLYALGERIAGQLETTPPDVIIVSSDWNASWATLGIRRTNVLTLGLPLFVSLSPAERVALVAHEIAHGRNGDTRRGLLVGSALAAQAELYEMLAPAPNDPGDEGLSWLLNVLIARPVMWLVSRPPYALLWLFARLTAHDSHRAEYQADELASRVAGTEAVVSLQETVLLDGLLYARVVRAAQSGSRGDGLMAGLVGEVRGVPPRERRRRRRVAGLETFSLDLFHPPMENRLAVIEARRSLPPAVTLAAEDSTTIDAELDAFTAEVERELVDTYRDAVYY